jgi:hypothetical protein
MHTKNKKILYSISLLIFISISSIIYINLIEKGFFRSDRNKEFQNHLVNSLNKKNTIPAFDFLTKHNFNYKYICINGPYYSPNETFSWQEEKYTIEQLNLSHIANTGFENYWGVSLFNEDGKGEFFSLYSPEIQIDTLTEPSMSKSCFSTLNLLFRKSHSPALNQDNEYNSINLIIK